LAVIYIPAANLSTKVGFVLGAGMTILVHVSGNHYPSDFDFWKMGLDDFGDLIERRSGSRDIIYEQNCFVAYQCVFGIQRKCVFQILQPSYPGKLCLRFRPFDFSY
jgi:hypothetical protein